MSATEPQYETPVALRAAITGRLRSMATKDRTRSLSDLLRQFAYDRLLYRIFTSVDAERWVLKGATALLARLGGGARHSIDVDLYDQSGSLEKAETALKASAQQDAGDQFRFVLAPGRQMIEEGTALRVPVTAYLGATEFAKFNVDLVVNTGMTGRPELSDPLVRVDVPGVPQTKYFIYPLADHVADKVFAIIERHHRVGRPSIASSRYRDLADLVVIARRETVDAIALRQALQSQSRRRSVEVPTELMVPDSSEWRAGYSRIARAIPGMRERDYDSAVVTARRFVDPLLNKTARGRWASERQEWVEH